MEGLEVETVEATVTADGKASIPVPEGFATPAAPAVPAQTFSGKPGNLMADLALIAAEKNPQPPVEPVIQPETTTATATAPATEVPDKFKNPDGTIATEKVEKSTAHAEQALAKALELERKLRQKQNEVAALKQGAPVPVPVNPAQVQTVQYNSLEVQVAQDLVQAHAEAGIQLAPASALAQARVSVRLQEARLDAESSLTQNIRERLDDQDRRRELEMIAKDDPWILSQEGISALSKIREDRPHVNTSDRPWTAAYREFLADQVISQRLAGQVPTPTPTARAAQPPATPVQAAPRIIVKPAEPDMSKWNTAQITAHVNSLPPKEQDEFYRKRGIRSGIFG